MLLARDDQARVGKLDYKSADNAWGANVSR